MAEKMIDATEEPLRNADLESALFGLRMALTPEEEVDSRRQFLDVLERSLIAIPTLNPVPTDPNGLPLPNVDIQLVIATDVEGRAGVPAFTTLGGLRAALPHVEHGMFLTGAQVASVLAASPHALFIDGPDAHVEVETAELQQLAQKLEMVAQVQRQAAERNERLELALAELGRADTPAARDAVAAGFIEEFCRLPVVNDTEGEVECLLLSMGQSPDAPQQEMQILMRDDTLLCFTSEDAMRVWNEAPRHAVVLPGAFIVQMAAQANILTIAINPGSPATRTLRLQDGKLEVGVE